MAPTLGPTLTTERLILRPPCLEDLAPFTAFAADEEATRYIGGVQTAHAAWRSLTTQVGSWALHGFSVFSVLERATGKWVGRVGPWFPVEWPGRELAWGLARAHQRKGYGFEAARAAMTWAFDVLQWTEIIHVIQPANTPSIRLAERLGAQRRGQVTMPAPFHTVECHVWGQTREQWRQGVQTP